MAKSRKDSRGRALKAGESERSDGRYMYRYSEMGGGCVYGNTLDELREKEKQIQRDIFDGIHTKLSKHTTLNDLHDADMKAKANLRVKTLDNYKAMWENNVRDSALGCMVVCDIKPLHVKSLYAEFERRGLAHSTIKFISILICSALEIAVESDLIRKNPGRGLKFGGETAERKALTVAEQNSLLRFLNQDTIYSIYRPMIQIFLGTGLRVSEACGLTWSDIDFKANQIHVTKQLLKRTKTSEVDSALYIQKTKTESGNRVIPMTETVRQAFIEQKKLMLMISRRGTAEVDGLSDFIFVTKNGTPYTVTNVNFILQNIVKAHNKESETQIKPFSAHILRHTAASRMAEVGIEPKALQMILGHSDIGVTFNVYVDIDEEHIRAEMQKTENIIRFA